MRVNRLLLRIVGLFYYLLVLAIDLLLLNNLIQRPRLLDHLLLISEVDFEGLLLKDRLLLLLFSSELGDTFFKLGRCEPVGL